MHTALRRLFVLSMVSGGTYAAWSWWQRQDTDALRAAPEWPPLPGTAEHRTANSGNGSSPSMTTEVTAEPATAAADDGTTETAATEADVWVEPVDGACPDGFPIKANEKSGIYHMPGGRFYDRTVPDRCYAGADDADADGYRAAKA